MNGVQPSATLVANGPHPTTAKFLVTHDNGYRLISRGALEGAKPLRWLHLPSIADDLGPHQLIELLKTAEGCGLPIPKDEVKLTAPLRFIDNGDWIRLRITELDHRSHDPCDGIHRELFILFSKDTLITWSSKLDKATRKIAAELTSVPSAANLDPFEIVQRLLIQTAKDGDTFANNLQGGLEKRLAALRRGERLEPRDLVRLSTAVSSAVEKQRDNARTILDLSTELLKHWPGVTAEHQRRDLELNSIAKSVAEKMSRRLTTIASLAAAEDVAGERELAQSQERLADSQTKLTKIATWIAAVGVPPFVFSLVKDVAQNISQLSDPIIWRSAVFTAALCTWLAYYAYKKGFFGSTNK